MRYDKKENSILLHFSRPFKFAYFSIPQFFISQALLKKIRAWLIPERQNNGQLGGKTINCESFVVVLDNYLNFASLECFPVYINISFFKQPHELY